MTMWSSLEIVKFTLSIGILPSFLIVTEYSVRARSESYSICKNVIAEPKELIRILKSESIQREIIRNGIEYIELLLGQD
jgi:hypothetical protein